MEGGNKMKPSGSKDKLDGFQQRLRLRNVLRKRPQGLLQPFLPPQIIIEADHDLLQGCLQEVELVQNGVVRRKG